LGRRPPCRALGPDPAGLGDRRPGAGASLLRQVDQVLREWPLIPNERHAEVFEAQARSAEAIRASVLMLIRAATRG
jgi:hypothetical protein